MPSSIAHASLAVLLQPVLAAPDRTPRLVGATALAAILPDLDAIGRPFGRGDVAWLGGHRALTHSLFAALLVALILTRAIQRAAPVQSRWRAFLFVLLVIAAHGVLDAFTTYGTGVEFFAPFSIQRFRAPWRPFDGVGLEMLVLWLPAFGILTIARMRRAHLPHASRPAR